MLERLKARRSRLSVLTILLMILMALLATSGVTHATETKATPADALKAAIFHVVSDAQLGSDWKAGQIKFAKPVSLYDADDNVIAYLVRLSAAGTAKGYVIIGSSLDEYPILEFAYSGNLISDEETQKTIAQNGKAVKAHHLVYTGPHRVAVQVEYAEGGKDLIRVGPSDGVVVPPGMEQKAAPTDPAGAREMWGKIKRMQTQEIGSETDGVTDEDPAYSDHPWEVGYDSMNQGYLSTPDWDQWRYYYDSLNRPYWTGCAPTSGADIMGYWQVRGYPNIASNNVVFDLRTTMKTTAVLNAAGTEYAGSTVISNVSPGLQQHARNKGYTTATAGMITSPSFGSIKAEISASRPAEITVKGQTYYSPNDQAHTVSLVGYKEYVYSGVTAGHQYMIIHDNWDTNVGDIYMAYGRNYTGIYLHWFKPQ